MMHHASAGSLRLPALRSLGRCLGVTDAPKGLHLLICHFISLFGEARDGCCSRLFINRKVDSRYFINAVDCSRSIGLEPQQSGLDCER